MVTITVPRSASLRGLGDPQVLQNNREHLIEHLDANWREYNERFARPITWSWTRTKMRRWVKRHAS